MFSYIATFCNVVDSKVSALKRAINYAVQGAGTGFSDDTPEVSPEEPAYGQLGILARPMPANAVSGSGDVSGPMPKGAAEALCLRVGDDLTPIAYRDLRINQVVPTLDPGQIVMAHYGGGYVGLSWNAAKTASTMRLQSETVSVGDPVTAKTLPYSEDLFDVVDLLRRCVLAPAVNGSPPTTSAGLTPLELGTLSAYGNASHATTVLKAN